LYYTLDKVNFKERLHPSTEFYFADACETLMADAISSNLDPFVSLFTRNHNQEIIMRVGNTVCRRDVDSLGIIGLETENKDARSQKEYIQMIESYLQIGFNLYAPLQIFEEEEHTLDFGNDSSKLMSIREEAIKSAYSLKSLNSLIKKGKSAQ